jgi:hypothetical protein
VTARRLRATESKEVIAAVHESQGGTFSNLTGRSDDIRSCGKDFATAGIDL